MPRLHRREIGRRVFTADVGYVIGLLIAPVLVSVLVAIMYSRRGWPHNYVVDGLVNVPGGPWRPRIRIALSILLGLFVLSLTSSWVLKSELQSSHSRTYTWVMKMTRYGDAIGADVSALNKAMTARSLTGVNVACFNGAADVQAMAAKPKAPEARLETLYRAWLVDAFDMFYYCQKATSSQAQYGSSVGAVDWNEAMHYARKADSAHARFVAYGASLN